MKLSRLARPAVALLCSCALAFSPGCSGSEEGMGGAVHTAAHKLSRGLRLVVDQLTGDMEITRPTGGTRSLPVGTTKTDNKNAWTIFVYLCGSDLESDGASATADLAEMLSASAADNVRFVVEIGGTSAWQNDAFDADCLSRFVVQDGDIVDVQTLDLGNMGASDTLADFLVWGTATYPSEHAGVILWDHGGGSIAGVCLDENYDNDALSLKELDAALLGAFGTMDKKFDFIGFDACLMGTLETANVLASYADYLYASEEVEPSTGWDYVAIANYLNENPQSNAVDLGRLVCDSYIASCGSDADAVTLSVVDLSKIDNVVKGFNSFSEDLCNAAGSASNLAGIMRGVNEADNYGGNNRSEGYTNMVDLCGIADACGSYVASGGDVKKAVEEAVVYNKVGSDHQSAGGLSVYYPLLAGDANELATFQQVCVSPYYLTFIDTVERTSSQDAENAVFDSDSWFNDGAWEWTSDYDYDDDTGFFGYDSDTLNEEYWSFENESQETGASPLISFAKEPAYDKDGNFGFVLSDEALEYATAVSAYVYEVWDDGDTIELGETCDVSGDWDTGAFHDSFDGEWFSLPDGQNLALYVAEWTDDYIVYTSPILLNGQATNLRMKQSIKSGDIVVEGAWDGIDGFGMAARDIRQIVKGDQIVPQYYSLENDGDEPDVEGESYTVDGDLTVNYALLQGSTYEYCFVIEDTFGDYLMTDSAKFTIDDEGQIEYW